MIAYPDASMLHQNLLPLAPSRGVLESPLEAPHPASAADTRYRPSKASVAFRRSPSRQLDGRRSRRVRGLEPYRGRECPFLEPIRYKRNGRRILVRTGMPEALRRELGSLGRDSGPIEIGAAFDPYPSVEARIALTRSVLEVLCEAHGLELLLTTRSPLVLRDQDLLRQLDLSHTVTVHVPIATLDARLANRIEPGASDPRSRLEIVRALAADGIATRILCDPVLPGINNSADELDPLFAAAKRSGAIDVLGIVRGTSFAERRRLLGWLAENCPDRLDKVPRRLELAGGAAFLGTLKRLRLAYGFPSFRTGRG